MKWLTFFLGMCLFEVGLGQSAWADGRLNHDQIIRALSGQSMIWRSEQEVSTQYFDPKGLTIYERLGSKPESGIWQVSLDDLFCSRWGRGAWACYQVIRVPEGMAFTGPVNQPLTLNNTMKGRLVPGNRTSGTVPADNQKPPPVMQMIGRIISGDYLGGIAYQ
jgi:hypothetical protein